VRELRSGAHGFGALGMRDQRHEPRVFHVLRQREQLIRRADERHLDQHVPRALEQVTGRVLLKQRRRRVQLEAEAQLEWRPFTEQLEGAAYLDLALLRQREVRPDVRRAEEDRRPRLRSEIAELEAFLDRAGTVVTRRHDVRMAIDETGLHAPEAIDSHLSRSVISDGRTGTARPS